MLRGHTTGTLCCVLGFASAAASAAEWSAQPALSLSADYDTNRRLSDPPNGSKGATLSASLDFARMTEGSRLSLRPRFDARRYDKVHDVLDSNDVGLQLNFSHKGELTTLGFGATAADDSTLTTELSDTGIIEGHARRRTLAGNADVSRRVGERFQVQAGAAYVDVTFDDATGTGLVPYTYPSAFIGFAVEATDRSQLRMAVNSSRFEIPAARSKTDSHSVRAYWRSNVNEQFSIELNGGVNRSETTFLHDQGPVYGLVGNWRGERSTLGFNLARDVEPSALGYLVSADSIGGSWSWNVGERARIAMSARYAVREDLLYGFYPERREYGTVQAAVSWRLDSHWNLELRGGAVGQAYEISGNEAHGERLALSISWSPLKYAVSR
jgi:hypothetical protein